MLQQVQIPVSPWTLGSVMRCWIVLTCYSFQHNIAIISLHKKFGSTTLARKHV